MKFIPGLWQHRNCTDLQLQVLNVIYEGINRTIFKALYVRKDFGWGPLLLNSRADVLIVNKDQYPNWRLVG